MSDDEKHEGVEGEEGEEDSEEVSPLTYIILTFHLVIDLTSYLAVYIVLTVIGRISLIICI